MHIILTIKGLNNKIQQMTQNTRKPGFSTLLTEKSIFEVQYFAGSSVVKIPPCV